MENLDSILDEDFSSDPKAKPKRSVYLLVLCILTWVGCAGYIFIFSISYIATNKELDYGYSYTYSDHIYYDLNYFRMNIASGIICAGSAVLMLLRFRFGFFIYMIAQIAPVVYVALYYVEMRLKNEEELVFILIVHPFIFVVLYSFAYKYIRR